MSYSYALTPQQGFEHFHAAFEIASADAAEEGWIATNNSTVLHVVRLAPDDCVLRISKRRYTRAQRVEGGLHWRPRDAGAQSRIASYFRRHQNEWRMNHAGFNALQIGNLRFFDMPLFPDLSPVEEGERKARFAQLLDLARPGDAIYSCEPSSWVSRLIARTDRGCWSHVAVYLGNEEVGEIDPSGSGVRSIHEYDQARFRLGLYRSLQADRYTEEVMKRIRAFYEGVHRTRYSYGKAIRAGIVGALELEWSYVPSPNALLRLGMEYRLWSV